jgi:hypothetical protein
MARRRVFWPARFLETRSCLTRGAEQRELSMALHATAPTGTLSFPAFAAAISSYECSRAPWS